LTRGANKIYYQSMDGKNGDRKKIVDELMAFFENILEPYLDRRFGGLENRMDGLENRMDGLENRMDGLENRMVKLESEVVHVKNDVRDLKADAPTSKEFEKVQLTVEKLEKLHKREITSLV
jgi:archaellum component FlaC